MESILTWSTLLFSLCVFIVTYLIRTSMELLFPTLSKKTPLNSAQLVWEEVVLLVLPVLLGVGLVVALPQWPFPAALTDSRSRMVYGAVCGFFSTWSYRLARTVLTTQFSVDPGQVLTPEKLDVPPAVIDIKPPQPEEKK